ncbi:hypothetical protein UA08_00999 [Talaromyces atroroseus]|uniref:Uncharacterized protein n=1 Tax=Talaromyces atroroseus TaxID=1441469 RepID=A0A225AS87_TALAT|nr:hypothetical protein UA08_00999 [Talaromyces atroroseus]OKL64461.1 hypothetical protein UA08_00999 [Talaromyces atroroseus]
MVDTGAQSMPLGLLASPTSRQSGDTVTADNVRFFDEDVWIKLCKNFFANKPAFDGFQSSADLKSFFPSSFWRIIDDDLNGAFGIEHHGETPGLLYGLWDKLQILTSPRHFARPYNDPFLWHALLIEELRDIYDTSVWELRHVVREWEKTRREEPDIEILNEIGRHLIHGNEVLNVADDTIDSVIYQHKLLHERQATEPMDTTENKVHDIVYTTVQDKLFTLRKDIKAINARAVTLFERLRHEINLAYHVAARNTTQISIDIAKIARRDNATMKALAFIGVLYLPGTFISGIFGSNFFNYNPPDSSSNNSDWNMSDKFWIYWAITIPVTMFTVLLWIVLDDTMEMYESLVSRVRAASRDIWSQIRVGKQPNTDMRGDVQAGFIDVTSWWIRRPSGVYVN